MGSTTEFQPLSTRDKVTVVIYRGGIVLSLATIAATAILLFAASSGASPAGVAALGLVLALYLFTGLSVFFIHLYMGNLKKILQRTYFVALACLVALLALGAQDLTSAFVSRPYLALLLIPVSLCLGFITAKEAYCFKLFEGYVLAVVMPVYLVLVATGLFGVRLVADGLTVIAALLLIFTLRKIFMPLHFDIGDKTAYSE